MWVDHDAMEAMLIEDENPTRPSLHGSVACHDHATELVEHYNDPEALSGLSDDLIHDMGDVTAATGAEGADLITSTME